MDYASKNWVISLINKVKALLTANGTGIVESGSNSYGEYEIFKNGRIHMTGWGFLTWTSGASNKDVTITLPYECADVTKMRVQAGQCGYKASDPANISDAALAATFKVGWHIINTTSFSLRMQYDSAVPDTNRRLFSWDVWGTV